MDPESLYGHRQLTAFSDNKAAYVCGAVAEDLQEATTYYYRVGDGEHWSSVQSFTTGYQNTGIQALVLGDLQESNNTNLEGILGQVDIANFDLTIQTGRPGGQRRQLRPVEQHLLHAGGAAHWPAVRHWQP